MWRKVFILSLMLAVRALSSPASAALLSASNPLLLDINGDCNAAQSPSRTQAGWTAWDFGRDNTAGPHTKNMAATHEAIVVLKAVRNDGKTDAGALGGRNRYQADGTYLSNMYQDFVYVMHSGGTTAGLGVDYLKLDFTFVGLPPDTTVPLTFSLFSWDPAFGYNDVVCPAEAVPPPSLGSKRAAWSTTNPAEWLADNGYPAGYQPENMPPGLDAEVLARASVMGPRAEILGKAYAYASTFCLDLTTNASGIASVTLYGWNDMTIWYGSQHMPLCGIRVVPEPATVALFGLGGLALLRKRKK